MDYDYASDALLSFALDRIGRALLKAGDTKLESYPR